MDLIDDLGNDLALAFLVEKKHLHKINTNDVLALIGRIKSALRLVSDKDMVLTEAFDLDSAARRMCH
jgi:hypothetical protein